LNLTSLERKESFDVLKSMINLCAARLHFGAMLSIDKVSKQYGVQVLYDKADLFVGPDDRIGLVGPNGTGKSTLFRMITGDEEHDSGTIRFDNNVSYGMLSQESQCRLGITVREEMESAFPEVDDAQLRIDALAEKLETARDHEAREALRQLSQAQTDMELQNTQTMEARIGKVLHGLNFPPGSMDRLTDTFSGGWQMRIAMAKLLLRQPDLLLLDEPTNHLDEKTIRWLMGYIATYPGAVFIISHDGDFLDATCETIVELDEGKLVSYTGTFSEYVAQKEENRRNQQLAYDRQQKEIERQQEFINRFGAKASKAAAAKSKEKAIDRMEKVEAPKALARKIYLEFPEAVQSSQEPMRLKGINKSYGEKDVLKEVSLKLKRGDRVALQGPNGAGKSTLLKIIAGVEDADAGIREEGRNVVLGYFAQHQAEALDEKKSVLDETLDGLPTRPEPMARNLLGRLLIKGDAVYKPVKVLSGGERSRVALAKFLLRPANLMLLDEPTNHLDANSREVLMEALKNYKGTLVLSSHDAEFVQAVATEIYQIDEGVLNETRMAIKGK
jgi:ATP-binding cassette subfamily F protein 3